MAEGKTRTWDKYRAVLEYPLLKSYVERFQTTSFFNEKAGLLSFFYLQGQALVDTVRVPVWASALDPRIHVFWIQPTRTGKTIAWEFIGEIAKLADLPIDMFTTGTDAALIGSFESVKEDDGSFTIIQNPGLLAGGKCLNFDEGSILLQANPKQFFSEVILYLQQAMNPIGSHSNTLTKHMKHGTIETESRVSFWITTFPPAGVKEYVLTKGLFQRVLLFYSPWSEDMRQHVSEKRMSGVFKDMVSDKEPLDTLAQHFKDTRTKIEQRLLKLTGTSAADWVEKNDKEKEEVARQAMHEMFEISPDFWVCLDDSVDTYYTLIRGMDKGMSNVVCSFIPNILNYTVLFAVHLGILEIVSQDKDEFIITGDHVEMATEIIYDVYEQLVVWLEEEVEVGTATAAKVAKKQAWRDAYEASTTIEIEGKQGEWAPKTNVLTQYGKKQDKSRPVVYNHYREMGQRYFHEVTSKNVKYLRWSGGGKND